MMPRAVSSSRPRRGGRRSCRRHNRLARSTRQDPRAQGRVAATAPSVRRRLRRHRSWAPSPRRPGRTASAVTSLASSTTLGEWSTSELMTFDSAVCISSASRAVSPRKTIAVHRRSACSYTVIASPPQPSTAVSACFWSVWLAISRYHSTTPISLPISATYVAPAGALRGITCGVARRGRGRTRDRRRSPPIAEVNETRDRVRRRSTREGGRRERRGRRVRRTEPTRSARGRC